MLLYSLLFFRTWWPVVPRCVCVTGMDRHLWTRPSLTYDNYFKVRASFWKYEKKKSPCQTKRLLFLIMWQLSLCVFLGKAEKLGQNLTKVPYKETFWKGTMRTRPRESWPVLLKSKQRYYFQSQQLLIYYCAALSGNGTINKQAGIDYKQLSLLAKINENQSGEVSVCRCVSFFPALLLSFLL